MDGIEICGRLREELPEVEVVFYTGMEELGLAERAFAAGAQAVVSKGDRSADLLKAVLLASRGRRYTSPVFAARAEGRDFEELSPKQLTVLRLLAQGRERRADRRGDGHRRGDGQVAPRRDPPQARARARPRRRWPSASSTRSSRIPTRTDDSLRADGRPDRGHRGHRRGRRRRRAAARRARRRPAARRARPGARAAAARRRGARRVRLRRGRRDARRARGRGDAVPRPGRGVHGPRRPAPHGDRRRGRGRRAAGSSTSRSSAPRPTPRSRSRATTGRPSSTSARPACRSRSRA